MKPLRLPERMVRLACAAALLLGLLTAHAFASPQGSLKVTAPWTDNGVIDARYSCDGADMSPALAWTGAPAATKSVVITCVDPDAPGGAFTHWIVYDLAADVSRLAENAPKTATWSNGARQGTNDFGRFGWGGPCPPSGALHHYIITVYALDTRLDLAPGARLADLLKSMKGHVLASGKTTGVFRH